MTKKNLHQQTLTLELDQKIDNDKPILLQQKNFQTAPLHQKWWMLKGAPLIPWTYISRSDHIFSNILMVFNEPNGEDSMLTIILRNVGPRIKRGCFQHPPHKPIQTNQNKTGFKQTKFLRHNFIPYITIPNKEYEILLLFSRGHHVTIGSYYIFNTSLPKNHFLLEISYCYCLFAFQQCISTY